MPVELAQIDVDAERSTAARWSHVPFGRSRFLGIMGAALFGLSARLISSEPAAADHYATPYPCHSAGGCHRCSGRWCKQSNWVDDCAVRRGCEDNPQLQCWNTWAWDQVGCWVEYRCCDWTEPATGGLCICSQQITWVCE